jgi:hypothetical protein
LIEVLTVPDTSVQYVGVTSDPDVYIAVVDDDGTIGIYLCDGSELDVWLAGEMVDGTLTATGADGSTAAATQAGGAIAGNVTLADGSTLDFSVTPAVPPAGFYERFFVNEGEPFQSRTIQLADGTAKGKAKKALCETLHTRYLDGVLAEILATTQQQYSAAGRAQSRAMNSGVDAGCSWVYDILAAA